MKILSKFCITPALGSTNPRTGTTVIRDSMMILGFVQPIADVLRRCAQSVESATW